MEDLIRRSDAIKAIHNYWKKRLDTLPTKESQCGEVYADIQQMDKILEHNKTLCNFINAIPSEDRPQGEWIEEEYKGRIYGIYRCQYKCFHCGYVPMHRGEPIIPTNRTLRFCPNCGARMFAKDTNVPNKKGADDE